jgi:uncharacterized membrane protein YeaQ/YmgE (transglycosylase-associated protein family)
MHLVWFLLVGLIAGWLAGKLTKGSGFGVLGDIVIGVIGAFIGGFLFRLVGIWAGGTIGSIIVATVGAIVLIYVVNVTKKA